MFRSGSWNGILNVDDVLFFPREVVLVLQVEQDLGPEVHMSEKAASFRRKRDSKHLEICLTAGCP